MVKQLPERREHERKILEAVFQGILAEGERRRAAHPENTPPDWGPFPDLDERYWDLDPKDWGRVPTIPQIRATDWQNAILLNDLGMVVPLVEAAMRQLGTPKPPEGAEWRVFLRLALVIAARAHAIDARRDAGDYDDGFPADWGVGTEQIPKLWTESQIIATVTESKGGNAPPPQRAKRKPGPRAKFPLVAAEAKRLLDSGYRAASVIGLCRDLSAWLQREHAVKMMPGSIENAFRDGGERESLLNQLCPPVEGVTHPHGYPRRKL